MADEPLLLATMNPMTDGAFMRLIKALGKEKGMKVGVEILSRMGVRELRTPNDLLAFGNHLIKHGGVFESVGRALKVSALLRGAVEAA